MPDLASHKAAAEKFHSLYLAIPGDYPEGKAIALFYCAVHLIELIAASEGIHNRNHADRERYIRNNHSKYWKHYRPLRDASEQARYLARSGFTMTSEQLDLQLYRRRFAAIRELAVATLGGEELQISIERASIQKQSTPRTNA